MTEVFGQRFRYEPLSKALEENKLFQSIYGALGGFFLYFSMYALRKPFKAATFRDENGVKLEWFNTGMTLKTAIVLFQLVGYTTSKWIGIKFVSEAKGKQSLYLIYVLSIAELSLIIYGILGAVPNYTPFAIFFNGLMLGVVWGLTVAYFEGRDISDFMLVSLSISFIVSSGIVKDVALVVLQQWGVNDWWMPSIVGALFIPLFLTCILMLHQLPPPSEKEIKDKANRVPMTHKERWAYYVMFWPGLLALWIGVTFLTAYRDYRDSYAVEIFEDMGYDLVPGLLSTSETTVASVLLVPIAAIVFIRSNILAFKVSMASLLMGSVLMLLGTYLYIGEAVSGYSYYVIAGLGSYLSYVPYNSTLYERLIAVLHVECTVSYLMAVMDAMGYVGVFVLFIAAEYSDLKGNLATFNRIGQVFGYGTAIVYVIAAFYFLVTRRNDIYDVDGEKAIKDVEKGDANGAEPEQAKETAVEEA